MKTSWPLRHLRCCLLRIHSSRRYDYTHCYHMWKSKIMDPIRYGWHACDDGTPLYPTTLTAGVSPVPLTILHLVKCRFFNSSPLGDVGACQLKRHVQCSCNAGSNCCNEQTRTVAPNLAADEADDDWKTVSKHAASNQDYACLMWKSKIMDPFRYGWHVGDEGTPLYPTRCNEQTRRVAANLAADEADDVWKTMRIIRK